MYVPKWICQYDDPLLCHATENGPRGSYQRRDSLNQVRVYDPSARRTYALADIPIRHHRHEMRVHPTPRARKPRVATVPAGADIEELGGWQYSS